MINPCESPEGIPFDLPNAKIFDLGGGMTVFEIGFSLGGPMEQDRPETSRPYEFFRTREAEEVFKFCKSAVEYIDENNVGSVILVDKSARPMWAGISEYWKLTHTEDAIKPNIFFVDPRGFEAGGNMKKRVKEELPGLFGQKDTTTLLLDTCIHDGDTVKVVTKGLEDAGFGDIKVGVVDNARNRSKIEPDIVLCDGIPAARCYPFYRDSSNLYSYSDRKLHSGNYGGRNASRMTFELRNEIKRIINDYANGKPMSEASESSNEPSFADFLETMFNDMHRSIQAEQERRRKLVNKYSLGGAIVSLAATESLNLIAHNGLVSSLGNAAVSAVTGAILGRIFGKIKNT